MYLLPLQVGFWEMAAAAESKSPSGVFSGSSGNRSQLLEGVKSRRTQSGLSSLVQVMNSIGNFDSYKRRRVGCLVWGSIGHFSTQTKNSNEFKQSWNMLRFFIHFSFSRFQVYSSPYIFFSTHKESVDSSYCPGQ